MSEAHRGFDETKPNIARVYNCLLGGKDHFAADREAAAKLLKARPEIAVIARANRQFMVRAVRYMADAGVRQFIDLGTGIPTSPNLHEVARAVHPATKVVYVDNDPVVASHARALSVLSSDDKVTMLQADIRDPQRILGHPDTRALIDFAEPVGVLFVLVLHCIDDSDDPQGIVAAFRDRMAPGSYLAISVATAEGLGPGQTAEVTGVFSDTTILRGRSEVERFFTGLDMVGPGLVDVSKWQATVEPEGAWDRDLPGIIAGVARKP